MNRQDCKQPDCPTDAELLAFSKGELDADVAPRVERCVEQCQDCLATLASFEDATGRFLAGMRGAIVSEVCSVDECARAVQIADAAINASETPLALSLGWTVPTHLRDLRLVEQIGVGGMGTIYRAIHEPMDRTVAVKLLPAHRLKSPEAIRRFQKEIKAVGKLSHPHIVQAFDAGDHEGTHFLVTEFVAGADLSQVVQAVGRLRIADACEIIRQAAAGLDHAHQHGLVHRDVKPSNIMLATDGCVKVLDLGLARLLENEGEAASEVTSAGQVMGTIDYMSPEQAGDSHNVDARTDIYSLGATLYKLLTGVVPLGDRGYTTLTRKITALASEQPTPIQTLRDEIPESLAKVVQQMLVKSPANRLATASEVVAALQPFTAGADLAALADSVRKPETARIDQTQVSTSRSVQSETRELVRPQPAIRSASQRTRAILKFAVGVVLAGVVLAGIVVIIRDRWGNEKARLTLDDDDRVEVVTEPVRPQASKNADNNQPARLATPPVTNVRRTIREFDPSQPMSRSSLVTRPATIEGIKSWTVETKEHRGPVRTVSFSPDGKWLASGGEDGTVRLREPEFGAVQKVLVAHGGVVHSLAWSPDSRYLASIDERCMVCVWDPENGGLVQSTEPGRYKGRADVVWSADRSQVIFTANLAGGWVDRGIRTLDLMTKKQETHLPEVRIHDMRRLSGKDIVFLGGHESSKISTWTEGSPGSHLVAISPPHTRGLAASPDGRLVAFKVPGNTERPIQVRRVQTGELVHEISFPKSGGVGHAPIQVAFSPDGSQLAVASTISDQVRVLDVRSGAWVEPIAVSGLAAYCLDVAWSPDGRRLAVAKHRGVAVCSTETRRCLASLSSGITNISKVTWSPSGSGLAVAPTWAEFRAWAAGQDALAFLPNGHNPHSNGSTFQIEWSHDANMIAIASHTSAVDVWSLQQRERIASLVRLTEGEPTVAWSRDDGYLGIGRATSLREVFGDSVVELKEHNGPVKRFEWSPDGRYLMTSEDIGGKTHVWDTADYTHCQSFEAGGGWGTAWSNNSQFLATTNGTHWDQQPMRLFEIGSDAEPKWEFKLGSFLAVPLFFLPDNRHLLVADHCPDRIACSEAGSYLVSTDTGNVVHKLKSNGVHAATCGQDGSALRVLDQMNVLRKWDVKSGRLKAELQGHVPYSESADWSTETETIASGADGSALHLWCARTGRPLGACLLCNSTTNLYLSPEGHYQLTGEYQGEFVYVVETDHGQETLSSAQFTDRFGWSNDPAQAVFMDIDLLAARRLLVLGGEIGIYARDEPIKTFDELPSTLFDIDRIWLWKNEQVADRDLQWLPKLKRLRSLSVALTGITDEAMKHVGAVGTMRWLYLDSTAVTDQGLIELSELSELETLSLVSLQVSKASLGQLTCHNLKNLYLRHSTIRDDDLEATSRFPLLDRLCLDNTALTNAGLKHLVGLEDLKELDLSGTKITDECLPTLQQLTGLTRLLLTNTALSDSIVSALRQTLPNCSIER